MLDKIPELPDLHIVPLAALRLHETCDEARVTRLVARLKADGMLRNPPIVAQLDDHQNYVVLDGATRTTALQHLDIRDVVVQVVSYDDPGVELRTWHHLVTNISRETCAVAIRQTAGLSCGHTSPNEAQTAVERSEALAAVMWNDGVACAIGKGDPAALDLRGRASLLTRMVDAYLAHGAKIFRLGTDHLSSDHRGDATAMVIFPRVRPADILELTANDARLPAGITRHVIPNRALRLNLPLDILSADKPLQEKNAWLAEMIQQKMLAKGVRYYAEPTFLFDE
jgi:hypothetical protein